MVARPTRSFKSWCNCSNNVYHAQSSYKPVKGLVAYSGASNVTQNAKVLVVLEIIQIQYLLLLEQKTIFIN